MTDKIEKEVAQKPESVVADEKAKVLDLHELKNVDGGVVADDASEGSSLWSLNC
jgi:hypothetical protein